MIGCSSKEVLKPIKVENRLRVKILPFDDLTGVYNKASEQLENRASALLDSDFIQIVKFSPSKHHYILYTHPNPFRSISNNDTSGLIFFVQGDVERCSYEKAVDISERIASYHFLGIWGLANYHDADLCGFSQFRLKIFNSQKKFIDSSIIFGASCGAIRKHSRKELIDRAITQASYNFIIYLFENFAENKLQLPERRETVNEDRANQIRYIYVDN
jgi:hypothetical protein